MNPRRKQRLYTVIAIVIAVIVIIGLILYALGSNLNLFYTPTEVIYGKGAQHERPHIHQRIRLGGYVKPGSIIRDPKSLNIQFEIYDTNATVHVKFNGILPDLFSEGQGTVAEGTLESGNWLNASQILAKHDENYHPPEIKKIVHSVQENHNMQSEKRP